ncbi:fimbria/pilus outer membrane usher protein [Serratia sp. N21D137]|uniref:fimbria/pilus outer membrane usher protein n=1 Tax=Serratia sp. N21D137 TaxID=3397495 RepID=UPI0039E1B1A8
MEMYILRKTYHLGVKLLRLLFLIFNLNTASIMGGVYISDSYAQKIALPSYYDKYQIPDNQSVYLDVELNGVNRGVFPFELRDDQLWTSVLTLEEIGLKITKPTDSSIKLMSLDTVKVNYLAEIQKLVLIANDENTQLPINSFTNVDSQIYPGTSSEGILLNYETSGTYNDNVKAANLFSELRAFNSLGTISNTALSQFNNSVNPTIDTTRLDTTMSSSWQDSMITLRVGDSITGSTSWSRSNRFVGLQLSRNFDLNPYLVSSPLVEFVGSTVTQSNVDLLVDGIKQYSTTVPPGPFVINMQPKVNGYGTAQFVVTDFLGQSKIIERPVFSSPTLLRKGLADWSVDLGKLRLGYGKSSFDYSNNMMLSSMLRYGVTSNLTLESQIETSDGLLKKGFGIIATPNAYLGEFSGYYAQSQYWDFKGEEKGVGYQWINGNFHFGGSISISDMDYRDISSLYGATINAKNQQFFLGFSLGSAGSISINHFTRTNMEQNATTQLMNFSWLKNLNENTSISVLMNQNLNNYEDYSIYVGMNFSLKNKINTALSTTYSERETVSSFSANRNAPSDGGLGWRVSTTAEKNKEIQQVDIEYLTQHARLTAGGNNQSNFYLGSSGSIVIMKNNSFIARQLDDAFAVVSTTGVPDVPVLLENRLIGKTNKEGYFLVSPLYSYQKNQISIDSLNLPPGYSIIETKIVTVPKDRTGSYVEFPIKPAYAAMVVLVDENDEYLPVGTEVFIKGQSEPYIVGFDGVVYLEGLTNNINIEAYQPKIKSNVSDRKACRAEISYSADKNNIGTLSKTVCFQ